MKKPDIVFADAAKMGEKPNIPDWARVLAAYAPRDAREEAERSAMLELLAGYGDALLTRRTAFAHFTASSMIFNAQRTKVLMAYHRIYGSWAWTGGHMDGETDFEAVARREAQEETGVCTLRRLGSGPASVEILPVWAHVKRGEWVPSHLHLNISYLFEADEAEPLRVAQEENTAVGWLPLEDLPRMVTEETMMPIYQRLLRRANDCQFVTDNMRIRLQS